MLVDTHCHINMLVKNTFDRPLLPEEIEQAQHIIHQAAQENVTRIINVGTSVIESNNCVALAKRYDHLYASIGIHPNDLTADWKSDIQSFIPLLQEKEMNKIVAIGEIGFDKHYPDYDMDMQRAAFQAQVELALTYNLPIIIHTRDAHQETLDALAAFKHESLRGIIHCFSGEHSFAQELLQYNFVLGIGGTITYPKNEALRTLCTTLSVDRIVLETDSPFLPIQALRGKTNYPHYIAQIAQFLAQLRNQSLEEISDSTTQNVYKLFNIQ